MTTRVVQWGTGNVGRAALGTIIDRPDLELVGLYVRSPDKVGVDAGALAGRTGADVGIAATSDLEQLLGLDADVVIHAPLPSLVHGDDPDADVAHFEALLASGKNVITTVGYMYPQVYGAALMDRLTTAAAHGGATFHGTGANPGWFGDLVPLLLSSLSLRIDAINVTEISNFQHYPSPQIMFDMMGFGSTPEAFAARGERHTSWLNGLFIEALQMVADGLGLAVDGIESGMETWTASSDLATAAGLVGAGTIAGQRWRWEAMVDGQPVISQETVWRMHADATPAWPEGDWSIAIAGDPAMAVSFPHGWNRNVLASTAAHALNAIGPVVAAPPGVATFLDLPMIVGRGAFHPHPGRP